MALRAALLLSSFLLLAIVANSSKEEFGQCMRQCQQRLHAHREQLESCQDLCEERFRESGGVHVATDTERGRKSEGEQLYFFDEDNFSYWTKTEHGHCKVLEKLSERSSLLRGLENYRIGVLKANPQTFILPHHFDAESVIYVARGRASLTVIIGEDKGIHDMRVGDVLRIPAGAVIYAANTGRNEKLHIVTIFKTISTPGEFREYFGAGGQHPESYYNSFDKEILEAALNVSRDKWESLFQRQQEGAIVKATPEQISALSKHSKSESKGSWPFGSKTSKPYNLLRQKPAHANEYGQLYEVTQKDYEELRDLDIEISIANISSGSMLGPIFNSEATKFALILSGCAHVEIVCPHIAELQGSSQWGEKSRTKGSSGDSEVSSEHYQRSQSDICKGSGFFVPAGHPQVVVSTSDDNVVVLCFNVNSRNNRKQFLAGRNNVMSRIDDEALELTFDEDSSQVREVFDAQEESLFFPAPRRFRGRGRGGRGASSRQGRLSNILDVA